MNALPRTVRKKGTRYRLQYGTDKLRGFPVAVSP